MKYKEGDEESGLISRTPWWLWRYEHVMKLFLFYHIGVYLFLFEELLNGKFITGTSTEDAVFLY